MSTDLQKYSTENQLHTIRRYAEQRGFTIVRVFEDSGRSGLRMDGRDGLKSLMLEVQSGAASFQAILVYDVSRWDDFRMLTKVHITNTFALGQEYESIIAPNNLIMMAASVQSSSRTSNGSWLANTAVSYRSRFLPDNATSSKRAFARVVRLALACDAL